MVSGQNNYADYVFSGNAIFTACSQDLIDGFVAVSGNKIIALGQKSEMNKWVGKGTKVYELEDKIIMPGFYDSHTHIEIGMLGYNSVDLTYAKSEEEAVKMVAEVANTKAKDDPIIIGYNWYHINWDKKELPTKESLDRIVPDKPVILFRLENHGVWLNSKGLELCNIDRNTESPMGGVIFKDQNGEPTGYLHEFSQLLVYPHIVFPKEKQLIKDLTDQMGSFGITSISDLYMSDKPIYDRILGLEKEGNLKIRYNFHTLLSDDMSLEKELREKYNTEKIKFCGIKGFIDGTVLGYTGLLVEPYSDKPDTCSELEMDYEQIRENVIKADKENFRVRLHCIGDGAVRFALDVFEEAREVNGPKDLRHSIAHIEVIHPDDIQRFSKLNVIADLHPAHVNLPCEKASENPYLVHLGERGKYCFNYKSIIDTGAKVAFGSDFPVVTLNPMLGVYRAVTRRFNDGLPVDGWNPEQRLTMGEVLQGYTVGSAYHDSRENELGTLETGKLADIVVLDRNLFEIPVEDIQNTKVLLTMVDGKIVYEK